MSGIVELVLSKHATPEFITWQTNGGLLFLRGPRCVGKTTTLSRICAAEAESGALTLWATGWLNEYGSPFGVLQQILDQLDAADGCGDQPNGAGPSTSLADRRRHSSGVTYGYVYARLLEIAAQRPLLIVVDDINYVDAPSQLFLRFVARRLKGTRIRLAMAERTGCAVSFCDDLRTDILRLPYTSLVRLRLLGRKQIARSLTEHIPQLGASFPGSAANRLAGDIHDLTGGNLLLVDVLTRTWLTSADPKRTEPTVDTTFHDCVRGMISDTDMPGMLRGAHAVAVLGDFASLPRLARLLGVDIARAGRVFGALDDLGMLVGGCLRSEMRRALLQDESFTARGELHLRAAHVLFEDSAPLTQVVEHLTAVGRIGAPWDLPLVLGLVNQALKSGSTDAAIGLLKLAKTSAAGPDERSAVEMLLLRTTWLTDPGLVASLLPTLSRTAGRGVLNTTDLAFLVRAALWHGFTEIAAELMPLMREKSPQSPHPAEVGLAEALYSLWSGMPMNWATLELSSSSEADEPYGPGADVHSLLIGLRKIHDPTNEGGRAQAMFWAEQVLQGIRVQSSAVETLLFVYVVLEGMGSLPAARPWFTQLSEALEAHPSPLWKALVSVVQARISLELGDLGSAYGLIQKALACKPWHEWGAPIAGIAALLVQTLTEMGRPQEAAEVLDRPIPSVAYQGWGGLKYVNARGRYHLATDRPHAALADFEFCRDLSASLWIEPPTLADKTRLMVPWRCGMAEAYLALGDVAGAREVLQQQLKRLPKEETSVHGTTLRLLAKTTKDGAQRLSLLKSSADTLERYGSRLQLAYTLTELAAAYRETSRLNLARTTSKRARRMAEQCEAGRLLDLVTVDVHGAGRDKHQVGDHPQLAELSSAERRVAVLAILGHTNREISGKLFITASTVEQHLTRIYRKLHVQHREDLLDKFSTVFMALEQSG
ncbi:helix-turn-helix transcriptional regulator [Streptomyces piniterrae]|uniref:Helix-turn-helix transcriptional regulator n=1 Tax=Streptomyces piniterrae TaxID=2571125 RepID=A0A4U0NVN2_9ACTN|nr:helix-turn-helix transcriptional regulator [Streptomyces piniterrae]